MGTYYVIQSTSLYLTCSFQFPNGHKNSASISARA